MTKKALLCFVGKYQKYAQELTAPAYELKLWQELLTAPPYSFDPKNVVSLLDDGTVKGTGKASRTAVLAELHNLLSGASKDDQLLFVDGSHGSLVAGRTKGEAEQALIVYPDGDPNLQNAAVRESDVRTIFEERRPPLGTDITFVLDCCYAANYSGKVLFGSLETDDERTAVPLAAPPVVDLAADWKTLLRFGSFAEHDADYERPIILAACARNEKAREIDYNGKRRLLFTARLLDRLAEKHDTFEGIINAIKKLHPNYRQTATLAGNTGRKGEKFPGQRESAGAANAPGIAAPDSAEGIEGKQTVADSVSTAETSASSINVRILGIASLVDSRDAGDPYKARVILPIDKGEYVEPGDLHFACIEFATHEMVGRPTGPAPRVLEYTRGGVKYERWLLEGHTISIRTGDPDLPFERLQRFHDHVPKMTVLCPELLPSGPRKECFDVTPRLDRFAAFLNIPSGSADIGLYHDDATTFRRRDSGDEVLTMLCSRFVRLNVPITTSVATIVLEPYGFPGKKDLVVQLMPGATFLVANAREIDITGDGGAEPPDGVPREQFLLNYRVAQFVPDDPVLPEDVSVPIDDCTITDWP
jgi:hypothetical protein